MARRTPRWDFAFLRDRRPHLTTILGPDWRLIGHHEARLQLVAHLEHADATTLFSLSGPAGSGKTALVDWMYQTAAHRVVNVRDIISQLESGLHADGTDVKRLLNELQIAMVDVGPQALLVYDDIDHDFLTVGLQRFVRDAMHALDMTSMVLTSRTPLPDDLFPLPLAVISLDRRGTNENEFADFLATILYRACVGSDAFMPDVKRYLFDLEQHTPDFRAFAYVLEMLLARHGQIQAVITAHSLYDLLTKDPHIQQFRPFPAVHISDDRQLSFRRKDKTELLGDLLMRVYETPLTLARACDGSLQGFDRTSFLEEADVSFHDAVMSMCLTQSPLDLVQILLGRRDIQAELTALQLDPAHLIQNPDAEAHLLIRGLGFTLVDAPRGLSTFKSAVYAAAQMVAGPDRRPEVINGAALSAIQQVECALLDLLHFWGSYLFGNIGQLVTAFNASHPGLNLKVSRLSTGEIVQLLRFIDLSADEVDKSFSLSLVGRKRPFSTELLEACETFIQRRNEVVHPPASMASKAPADLLKRRCRELLDAAIDLLTKADAGSYPAVIKLSEIIFDEYSRRIFRGIDADGNEIRFAITDTEGHDDLVVASHYYMLPAKRVMVNPLLVPTSGTAPPVLFERAEAYEKASHTQRRQGLQLLDLVQVRPNSRVLDVGCGTGTLTIQLAAKTPEGHVDGIDISPEMVRFACAKVEANSTSNVTIEIANLLNFYPSQPYDVVFSNSVMHWILPPELAYKRLFELLRPAGTLAVHQGGHRCYIGLWECASDVIEELNLQTFFSNWTNPVYYPTVDEYRDMLSSSGFININIQSFESNGLEFPSLVSDFANAGLLPFMHRLPETERDAFRTEFRRRARLTRPNLYTHRLFTTASRP